MDQKCRTYLIYGDSGAGKSSFIKSMNGRNMQEQQPETGGHGNACTVDAGHLYYLDDDELGQLQLIDTRGTWDPSTVDNNEILDALVRVLVDFSIQNMKKNLNPVQSIDGVIYVHTSLNYDRYARNARIAHLSSLIGVNLDKSTVTLMTHYASINQLSKLNDKFHQMLQQQHTNPNQYVLWDSEEPLENQKQQLSRILQSLKPFDLKNIEDSNNNILEAAKKLQMEDLVPTLVTRYNDVVRDKEIFEMESDEREKQITLTVDCPQSITQSILSRITYKLDYLYSSVHTQNYKIDAQFPHRALNPKTIVGIKIVKQEFQNAEFTKEPEFNDKQDYFEAKMEYRWKALQDHTSLGRIDLKLSIGIQYRVRRVFTITEKVEVKTTEMLPRYVDEKPYLMLAQEQMIGSIFEEMRNKLQ